MFDRLVGLAMDGGQSAGNRVACVFAHSDNGQVHVEGSGSEGCNRRDERQRSEPEQCWVIDSPEDMLPNSGRPRGRLTRHAGSHASVPAQAFDQRSAQVWPVSVFLEQAYLVFGHFPRPEVVRSTAQAMLADAAQRLTEKHEPALCQEPEPQFHVEGLAVGLVESSPYLRLAEQNRGRFADQIALEKAVLDDRRTGNGHSPRCIRERLERLASVAEVVTPASCKPNVGPLFYGRSHSLHTIGGEHVVGAQEFNVLSARQCDTAVEIRYHA